MHYALRTGDSSFSWMLPYIDAYLSSLQDADGGIRFSGDIAKEEFLAGKSPYFLTGPWNVPAIAEAGIEYYRWHLAHSPDDYMDGTANPGPYVHDFNDKNGTKIGQFSLVVTPPSVGSTKVVVKSTGTVTEDNSVARSIEVELAVPSLAKYAVLNNTTLRMGAGTETFGAIHANGGVHFDGLAHNIVTSGTTTYKDTDFEYQTIPYGIKEDIVVNKNNNISA